MAWGGAASGAAEGALIGGFPGAVIGGLVGGLGKPSIATQSKRNLFSAGNRLETEGGRDVGQGLNILGEPTRYYEGLLGSRQKALEAAGPDIATIQGQAKTAARSNAEFAPRGGGRVSQAAQIPYTTSARIQSLIERQRPEAAAALTNISGMLQTLGLEEQGLGIESLASAAGIDLKQTQLNNETFGQLGKAAGTLLAMAGDSAGGG